MTGGRATGRRVPALRIVALVLLLALAGGAAAWRQGWLALDGIKLGWLKERQPRVVRVELPVPAAAAAPAPPQVSPPETLPGAMPAPGAAPPAPGPAAAPSPTTPPPEAASERGAAK